jgi:hypothetical protein
MTQRCREVLMHWDLMEASIFCSRESGRQSFTCCLVSSLSATGVGSAGDAMPLKITALIFSSWLDGLAPRPGIGFQGNRTICKIIKGEAVCLPPWRR